MLGGIDLAAILRSLVCCEKVRPGFKWFAADVMVEAGGVGIPVSCEGDERLSPPGSFWEEENRRSKFLLVIRETGEFSQIGRAGRVTTGLLPASQKPLGGAAGLPRLSPGVMGERFKGKPLEHDLIVAGFAGVGDNRVCILKSDPDLAARQGDMASRASPGGRPPNGSHPQQEAR